MLQSVQQGLGVLRAVGFHHADHHVGTRLRALRCAALSMA
jgi:hypothetical protein